MSPAKKLSVAQTCNQLSLFLKEKGCLRDLRLGFNPKADDSARMTIDLLSNMENPDQNNAEQTEKLMNSKPEDSEKKPNSSRSEKLTALKPEESEKKANSSRSVAASESRNAQMTIFYDGQVIVIDDIPADRAKDVMLAAGAGEYPSCTGKTETRVEFATNSSQPSDVNRVQTNGLDLPIARRASLHKFLAKRKDRATVRAPYQLQNPSPAAGSSKPEHNFDLNL